MCGIAGIIDLRGREIPSTLLDVACRSLAHRGPDDHGIWTHRANGWTAGLAHTRLAVIDPAPEAHQPMVSPDGQWAICYNGELYNYRQLKAELPGSVTTSSDTEVMLAACRAWGPDALRRFDGMWATAIVDAATQAGHLSRDPFGIKPLYYHTGDGKLTFASELATLTELIEKPLEIDPDAVAIYLQLGYIPHPMTIYRQVRKLPPGTMLRFSREGVGVPERYYVLPERSSVGAPSYPEACRELRQLVQDAVVRQCVADVPLGAFLSGGLDSSVVVACMAGRAAAPVRTFSIGYADHDRYDETAYARMVARHLGTEHREFRLSFQDVLAAVEPMLNHLGEPFADSSLLPTSLVSRYTREHVTVALSGDGGDELFGGYWRYLGHHYLERYRRVPGMVRKGVIEPLLKLVPDARSTKWLDRLRQVRKLLRGDLPDPMDRHLAWAQLMDARLASALLGASCARRAMERIGCVYREAAGGWRGSGDVGADFLEPILLADLAVGLPGDMLMKVDTASMYHALEVRVPLLSRDVVEFVSSLPLSYRISGTTGKRILRDAFRGMLPEAIFTRRKMGFEVPVGEFLRNELREMYTSVVTESTLSTLGIDPGVSGRVFQDHLYRRQDRTELLWSLLVLCWWHQRRLSAL